MSRRERAGRLRRQFARLAAERNDLQRRMLRPGRMIAASLIARRLGTGKQKRSSAAYYLSWAEGGKTVLRHVAKRDLEGARLKVQAWRAYRQRLRRCRQIARRLLALLGQLGQELAERPGKGGRQ